MRNGHHSIVYGVFGEAEEFVFDTDLMASQLEPLGDLVASYDESRGVGHFGHITRSRLHISNEWSGSHLVSECSFCPLIVIEFGGVRVCLALDVVSTHDSGLGQVGVVGPVERERDTVKVQRGLIVE